MCVCVWLEHDKVSPHYSTKCDKVTVSQEFFGVGQFHCFPIIGGPPGEINLSFSKPILHAFQLLFNIPLGFKGLFERNYIFQCHMHTPMVVN